MPNTEIVIPVGQPECDPSKAAECTDNKIAINLSQNNIEVAAHASPDCAFLLPIFISAGLFKVFLTFHERVMKITSESKIEYTQE